MWQEDVQMFDGDEVVPDGAPQHFSNNIRNRHFPSQHSPTEVNKYISKNTDSGFLSGVSIQEDSCSGIISSSLELTNQETFSKSSPSPPATTGMKLDDNMRCSDSGLDLKYTYETKGNNLNTPTPVENVSLPSPRRVTLHDLLRQDEDGDTPLHIAVIQGFIEIVFSLVRILSDPCLLGIPNRKLQTPLHLAVLTNQAPLVRRLVVGGASILQQDRNGNTPLHLACRDGSLDCARALLIPVSPEERRAALLPPRNVQQPRPQDLELRNYDGQMPIHLSAMNGHVQIARLLCCFGANINATEGKYGRTALHYAVERRQPALLPCLIKEWGAETEAETYAGYTAYQLAAAATPMLAVLLAELGAQQRPSPLDRSSSSSDSEDGSLGSDGEAKAWRSQTDMNMAMITEALQLMA